MKWIRCLSVLFAIITIAMLTPVRLHAQADRGAIKGTTQDPSKASIPGAKITLRNDATGVTTTSESGPSGQFSFLNIEPGHYTVTTEAPGFSTSVQQHVEVGVGSTIALNVTLKPGQVQQTVTVSSAAATIETQTSDVGTTITPQEIKDLPVTLTGDMRNPLNFVLFTPGVAASTPGPGTNANGQDYRLHISGSVSYSNETYIDGIPVMNTDQPGAVGYNHPPIDAIGQFKLINNNSAAQYGLSSGIVSFAFNSGTNVYHGSAYDYLQNDALNAAGFTTNYLHLKKAPLKQNEFGGTFGGPVWIPRIYNGHDKTFFFVNWTGFAYRPSANNATLTTIPNLFRDGNFSQQLGPQLTDPVSGAPVFDPAGRPVYSGAVYDPDPLSVSTVVSPYDGKTYQVRNPFPGNIIPSNFPGLSPVSQKVLQSFPQADNNDLQNNFHRLTSSKIDEHRLVVKIDEHINEKHSISGSVFTGGYVNSDNGHLNLLDAQTTNAPTKQFRFTWNWTHSPTLLNNLNLGFIRDNFLNDALVPGPGLAALGITGMPELAKNSGYPGIGIGTVQNGIGGVGGSTIAENRYIINDNVTLIRGPHTFTMGGEVRWLQRNEHGIPGGSFTFEPAETALNGTGFANGQATTIPVGTGAAAASFLFGGVDFVNFGYPIESAFRWWQTGFFFQDDWRVTPNLTLNLGVRWDLQIPRTDTHGDVSTMDPTLPNPAAGGIPGAMTYYGTGPGRNGKPRIGEIDYKGWQPRIGFAWSPGNHMTAFRGGFAITRPLGNDNVEGDISGNQYTSGFSGAAVLSRPQDYLGSPAYYWQNTFPASGVVKPNSDLDPAAWLGNTNPPMIHPSAGIPPTQLYWTSQIQHQFNSSIIGTIGYVGMHTYHVGVWSKPNEVNPTMARQKYTSVAAANGMPLNEFLTLPISDPRVAAAGILPPWPGFQALFGNGATAAQALRPWPQYGDVDNPINPIGSVSYNGLQSSLQKRFSQGLTFLLSYTFAKTIGNVDSNSGPSAGAENAIYAGSFAQDYYNPRGERSVTSSDIPHVVSLSYTYELPFGKNKRFLNHGGAVNTVVGGWSVSGIHQYQSGRPIHIEYDAFGPSNPFFAAGDGFSFRPNIVPNQPFKNPAYSKSCSHPTVGTGRNPCQFYINPAAFSLPAPGDFGNAPNLISALRLPAYINEDLSISKRTTLHENLDLQFQANFFNAFNRVIFSSGGNAQTFIINAAPPDLSTASLQNSQTIFGIMTTQQNAPRIIQFGMKLEF
jgi:hypothetical protein